MKIPPIACAVFAVLLAAATLAPGTAGSASLDFSITNGHFFTQTSGTDGTLGFTVVDDDRARFWSEFQRLGGVAGVGYPVSQRFVWNGFVVQAMQKGVLQWRPEVGRAYLVNVFDQLSAAGKDEWLSSERSTPRPLPVDFDANKHWDQVVRDRLALLDANLAIKTRYFAAQDAMNVYGLPTSRVIDNGNHFAIRLQRAVIQQWKVRVPWAQPSQVTVANGGDVGKEAGLFPSATLEPTLSNGQPQPTSRGGARANSPEETALAIVNDYRAIAGSPPLTLDSALMVAARAHASYYVQNYGDSKLAGMGLHSETPGRPGFTGSSWNDRAKVAGYRGTVDENIGLVGNPQRTIDWFIETTNHRFNIMHPSAVHLGHGMASKPGVDVFDIGFSSAKPNISLPTVYPGAGQKGLPTSVNLYETPDPLPGVPRPVGFPVTISFLINDNVSFGSYSMVDSGGAAVDLHSSPKSWLRSLALVPKNPLKSAETYTVTVSGVHNQRPFNKTWSFNTR